MKSLRKWWRQYRYRFVPWLALNLRNRSVRAVDGSTDDKLIPDNDVLVSLETLFKALFDVHPQSQYLREHMKKPVPDVSLKEHQAAPVDMIHKRSLCLMRQISGFCIERKPSKIPGCGTGVIVTKGTVPKHAIVAMYPGLIYYPYDPVLLQSVGNPFIFRCVDGLFIDGNDKGLSKFLYRSCAGRDRLGPFDLCDKTWLTVYPKNPLAVGQYVNNHNKDFPANVCYQECNLPTEFALHLRQYVPNVFYRTPDMLQCVRMVALVSLREIAQGEELFSSYFTMIH
ncbi:hypothetical protein LSH36_587g01068 [Paralvinella palmiformis]|uniref:SET domain-containing protein n=1 Tax=Paralvinella palmiformis TaxID=53620 RepID=A0AAD9J5D7_9ANNE|nr:hypothetical protein LSH36_587g01068 [Paralvinella palmiformis]